MKNPEPRRQPFHTHARAFACQHSHHSPNQHNNVPMNYHRREEVSQARGLYASGWQSIMSRVFLNLPPQIFLFLSGYTHRFRTSEDYGTDKSWGLFPLEDYGHSQNSEIFGTMIRMTEPCRMFRQFSVYDIKLRPYLYVTDMKIFTCTLGLSHSVLPLTTRHNTNIAIVHLLWCSLSSKKRQDATNNCRVSSGNMITYKYFPWKTINSIDCSKSFIYLFQLRN
jgi:hypothetical protein